MTVLMSPPPRAAKIVISLTCLLRYETGTLDYCEIFTPTSFINTICIDPPSSHSPRSNQPLIMNILIWNVRGVRRVFRELVTNHKLDVVILIETRVCGERASGIIATLGFERYVKVDAMGFASSIWVLWNPHTVYMEPVASSFEEIYLQVRVSNKNFLLFAIYVSLTYAQRKNSLVFFYGPYPFKKTTLTIFGGRPPSQQKLNNFNHFLDSCELVHLGYVGPRFT